MNDITNGNVHSSQASSNQSLNDDANKQQREYHRIKFTKWLADDYPKVLEQPRIKKNSKKGIQVSEDQENEHHSTSSIISWEKAQLIKDCLLSKHNEIEKKINYDDEVSNNSDFNDVTTDHVIAALSSEDEDDTPIATLVNKANEKIKVIREKIQLKESVYENMRNNADKAMKKMEDKHNHKRNKKTYDYQIDDHVSVKIPSIDHGGTELRRLPCVIVDVKYDKYQLACQWGILEDLYGAQHLELYHGLIEFDSKIIENSIGLRTAAIAASNGKRDKPMNEVEVKCNCMANQCQAKNCKCFNSGLKCNSHCHSKTPTNKCKNKD